LFVSAFEKRGDGEAKSPFVISNELGSTDVRAKDCAISVFGARFLASLAITHRTFIVATKRRGLDNLSL